jgi:hypothetical protein
VGRRGLGLSRIDAAVSSRASATDYTTARAAKLDNLDVAVSTRSTFAGGAVASVTGAVGSVTGNVGGNVTGTVGSVVGAVGSVTGNVGGNVVGSVASVTAGVTLANGAITAAAIAAAALNGKGDWLLASGYTAPDNTGIANAATGAARFLTMIVASGINWTYTADAVKNAPAGGGGGGSAIDEDSSITLEDSTVTVS